jgi:hypothetical protein
VNSSVHEVKYRGTSQIQKNQKNYIDISNKYTDKLDIIENKILQNGADILVISSECLLDLVNRNKNIVSLEYTTFIVVEEIQNIMEKNSWEKNPLNIILDIEKFEYLNQFFFIYDNICENVSDIMNIHYLFRKWLLRVNKNLQNENNHDIDDTKNDNKNLENLVSMKNFNEIQKKKNIEFRDILVPGKDFICLSASFDDVISVNNDIFYHVKNQKINFCLYFNPFLVRKDYYDSNLTFIDILSTFSDENFPLKIYFCDYGMIELRLNEKK